LPRIEAGDLSSHVYNAWLARLIAEGKAPGLWIQPQWTNVLFDLELSALWGLAGPAAASKIAVALAVLVFAWGGFAFARAASRTEPWFLMPVFAMLSYGWVFHMGLFNFYLSLGLCFWALSLTWRTSHWTRIAGTAALLALAATAHALPVAWALFAIGYREVSRRMRPRYRALLVVAAVAALVALRVFLRSHFLTFWWIEQWQCLSGTDQVAVYGGKYQFVQLALLAIWMLLLGRVFHGRGWRRTVLNVPLQIVLITATAVAIIPSAILLPGYGHKLVFIAERMSLAVAVCICAVFALARPKVAEIALMSAAAIYFFGFLYVDARALNGIEDKLEQAVAQAPPGARVVTALSESEYRIDPLMHLIDRVCVGRCFAYANYEPGTRQFRIRATPGNPIVVATYEDSALLQTGHYQVKPDDLPLWGVFSQGDDLTVRMLAAQESFQMARLLEK
jgi:hypothetical protein